MQKILCRKHRNSYKLSWCWTDFENQYKRNIIVWGKRAQKFLHSIIRNCFIDKQQNTTVECYLIKVLLFRLFFNRKYGKNCFRFAFFNNKTKKKNHPNRRTFLMRKVCTNSQHVTHFMIVIIPTFLIRFSFGSGSACFGFFNSCLINRALPCTYITYQVLLCFQLSFFLNIYLLDFMRSYFR